MSLLFSLLMKADAGQAKAELRALSGEVAKSKAEVTGLGNAASAADGKVDALGTASARAAAQNEKLAQTQTRVGATAGAAAGSVGNLVANFNDVAMMIAAGQSPLQLAIQQGTQITQVIGPMGAAGAFKTLGTALLSMLSPFNLLTLGAIGFGSAAVQWFIASGDAAMTLTDAIEGSATAIADLKKVSDVSIQDLREDFGAVTSDVVEMQAALGKLATVRAFQAQAEALRSLKAETEGSWFAGFTSDRFTQGGQIADILGTDWLQRGKLVATKEVAEFRATLNSLETARGPQAQLDIFKSLQQQMIAATGGVEQMTLQQMAYYDGLLNAEAQLREAIKARADEARRAEEAARETGADNGRMGGPMGWDLTREVDQPNVNNAEAQELLATLNQQAEVQQLISQYGRESEQVALARLEAERAAFVEMVQGMDAASGLKTELIGAWDAANGLASARIAAAIEAALGPASRLAGLLKSAAGWLGQLRAGYSVSTFKAGGLAAQYASYGQGRVAGEQAVRSEGALYGGDGNIFTIDMAPVRSGSGSGAGRGGSGGGAKAAREERDAVAELIQKLREEQETLIETDPVKREMLKYRKQLAEATVAERAEIEGLIRAEQQLKAVQAAREYATDAVGDFLDQIIAKGGKASDVLKNLAVQFLSMAARSVLSGQGWFANLLGISGGLFGGGKAAAALPSFGGKVASGYQPVLARVDSQVGKSIAAAPSANRPAPVFHINVQGATGNDEIRKMTAEGVRAGLKHYDAYVLPGRVEQIKRAPRDR